MAENLTASSKRVSSTRNILFRGRLGPFGAILSLIPFTLLLWTGLSAIDYGAHWDERAMFIRPVEKSIETETLLPFQYYYPSFGYALSMVILIPDLVSPPPLETNPSIGNATVHAPLKRQMLQAAGSQSFHLRLRSSFLFLSSLAVLWVFLLVQYWRKSLVEALLASCFLASSWEVAYHVRWLAPDGLVMQFGALVAFLSVVGFLKSDHRLLFAAAAAAGLATGTKYPAGLTIVPVVVASWFIHDNGVPFSNFRRSGIKLFVVFAATYLATTPGMLLQPLLFLQTLHVVSNAYGSVDGYTHGGYHVGGFTEHAWKILEYFVFVLFSKRLSLAVLGFLLAGFGAAAYLRSDRRAAVVFLSFPVIYLVFFSTRETMIVRNLLVVAPFLAVLAARGLTAIWTMQLQGAEIVGFRRLLPVALRSLVLAFVLIFFPINFHWLMYAAQSIAERHSDRFLSTAAQYINQRPDGSIFVTPRVRASLEPYGLRPQATTSDASASSFVAFWMRKDGFKKWQLWPTNHPRLIHKQFGPYEVNLNYYMTWVGDDRILLMRRDFAERFGILQLLVSYGEDASHEAR